MNELTHLDLFSGIGGFALAAQRAGFRTVGFSEVEPYACRLLSERFPDVPNLGDVRKRESFTGVGNVTVLTGGFPCQPFSIGGRKRGTRDDRNLWPAMLGVIDTVRPSWVIGENVPNLKNMALESCVDALEERGFQSQVFDIAACAVGLPTMERHLWIIATRLRIGLEGNMQEGVQKQPKLEQKISVWGSINNGPENKQNGWLLPQSKFCRSRKGVPGFVDRIKGLGNAIVPQVAEPFFHWIAQIERGEIA